MYRTNGLVTQLSYNDYSDYLKKKKICQGYQQNSIIKTNDDEKPADDQGVSVSFAAGIKFSFKEKSGFSMQVLTPEQIANEHNKQTQKTPENLDLTPKKGAGLNIYC